MIEITAYTGLDRFGKKVDFPTLRQIWITEDGRRRPLGQVSTWEGNEVIQLYEYGVAPGVIAEIKRQVHGSYFADVEVQDPGPPFEEGYDDE